MNFSYENQGANTYLVYRVEAGDSLDSMSLGMLTNNKISGFSSALFTQMNEDKYIKYNISSKVSAKQLFYGTVNRKRLLSVFKGIVDAMLALDDYMIDMNSVLLDLDYIFVDPSTYEVNMICLPVEKAESAVSLHDFIKDIMFSTQFEPSENCDYVTRIINYLNATPTFSVTGFKPFIDSLVESKPVASPPFVQAQEPPKPVRTPPVTVYTPPQPPAAPPEPKKQPPMVVPTPSPISENASDKQTSVKSDEKKIGLFYLLQHYNKENLELYKKQQADSKKKGEKKSKAKPVKSSDHADMGFAIPGQEVPVTPVTSETPHEEAAIPNTPPVAPQTPPAPVPRQVTPTPPPSVPVFNDFDDDEGTVVIGAEKQERRLSPHLIRSKTGERISITKPVFKIGRSSDLNDYNIRDNRFIGHCHCHIVTRDTDYYIVDDNTKNHTYVNGQMITGSTEVRITDGCILRFADEEFEFKLY